MIENGSLLVSRKTAKRINEKRQFTHNTTLFALEGITVIRM